MAPISEQSGLNVHSWLALNTFLVVIFLVIVPVRIPIRWRKQLLGHVVLDLATAPALGVLFLLATGSMHIEQVRDGFLGTAGIQPYSVMILFYALAYLCISLDMTGILQYFAFRLSKRGGSNGRRLFTYFFLLTTIFSTIGNDVVILTATTFLIYFTRVGEVSPPTAFFMAEFISANIGSMVLYIGNPTNVVVAEAFGVSFLSFSAWMLLPTLAAISLSYTILRIYADRSGSLPHFVHAPENLDPRVALTDSKGALFGAAVLLASLSALIGTSYFAVPVWMVTLPFALIMLIRDGWYDCTRRNAYRFSRHGSYVGAVEHQIRHIDRQDSMPPPINLGDPIVSHDPVNTDCSESMCMKESPSKSTTNERDPSPSLDLVSDSNDAPAGDSMTATTIPVPGTPSVKQRMGLITGVGHLKRQWRLLFPTVYTVMERMPFKILPFALGMFMLVEELSAVDFISIFARGISSIATTPAAAAFFIGWLALLLCSLLNNLPMTILMTRILQHPNFYEKATPATRSAALFALVIASNLGAILTPVASLAGIMFQHILRSRGAPLAYSQFVGWCILVTPIVATSVFGVLLLEVWFVYER
ncbi:uncharacterized protein VTP21DRAFT_5335 [Calcarisporiella thermophila]|uniref:uncharacterized protein n=1 Tax=Calcarisporiella thermophila TaxID=911321 RepID=UPI0037442705